MSKSRHTEPLVRSYSVTHPPGVVHLPTRPGWDQVLFAPIGLFTADADADTWTVPRHRALCVGNGATVRLHTTRQTPIRCLYVDAGFHLIRGGVRIVSLTPLGRELLARAVAVAPMDLAATADRALVTLLSAELDQRPDEPLRLPLPLDPAARAVADAIVAHPAQSVDWHIKAGFGHKRTIERRFRAETAMTLGQWRRRSRILSALALLSDGCPVTDTALAVGYSSSSSFIAAFRAEMGQTPRHYVESDVQSEVQADGQGGEQP